MTFLEIARNLAARGFYVFPCKPRTKKPLTQHGFLDASNDPEQIRAWWTLWPDANVAIAAGKSGVAVLDVDHGLESVEGFQKFRAAMGLPDTYAVRTGRRDGFGVQVYFRGTHAGVGDFRVHGCQGQVKSLDGYVMAEGCIHPDSGERYECLCGDIDRIAPMPDSVSVLQTHKLTAEPGKPMEQIPEGAGRHAALASVAGKLRASGLDEDAIYNALVPLNESMCAVPVSDEDLHHIAESMMRYTVPEPVGEVVFGKASAPVDWRTLFHTRDAMVNAPPIRFLIKDYLMREGVTAIAAPVRERKSLIALNIVHALLTGEKLFDHFEVVQKPSRVLYLCPEVSLGPFTDRVRKIGLLDYVGETLFCRTLSADGHLALDAPELAPALPGSVVILDTAIRFLTGDENSSADVRAFADSIFALLRAGAESVVMLHHSPKESGDVMTLENAMRGSGDMGAFLACCWGTRLQDPTKPYESASFLSNLKQRDFESADFEVTCSPDCRMHIVGDPDTRLVTAAPRKNRTNKDGLEDAAIQFLRDHPELSLRDTAQGLKGAGIRRGKDWVRDKRYEMLQENGGQMPCLSGGGKG